MSLDDKWHEYELYKHREAFETFEKGIELISKDTPDALRIRKWLKKNADGPLRSSIACILGEKTDLNEWEKTSAVDRIKKAKKVAKLARQLADELTDFPLPERPLALSLVDNWQAVKILNAIFTSEANISEKDTDIVPILSALGNFADTAADHKRRDIRPNMGNPKARILARRLAETFIEHGKAPSTTVIAAAVSIYFPELDPPPNTDTISDWIASSGSTP